MSNDRFLLKAVCLLSALIGTFFLPCLGMSQEYAGIDDARIAAIAKMLPEQPRGLGQPCADRAAWAPLGPQLTKRVTQADLLLPAAFPAWSDEDYLDYFHSGSRDRGQKMLFARLNWIAPLVLAECAQWKGRYLAKIVLTLDELAQQKSWALPPHDVDQGYVTGKRYFVELVSADIANSLAMSLYLLGNKVPAATRQRVVQALETRTFGPMRASYRSGKGQTWLTVQSNWNAVCLGGVTGAALTILTDRQDRALFVAAAERYSDYYMKSFPADGYEPEGIGYWNYGFSHFAELREEMWQATQGKLDIFRDPKVHKVALFGNDFQMLPGVYAYFSDAVFGTEPDPELSTYLQRVFGLRFTAAGPANEHSISTTQSAVAFELMRLFPSKSAIHGTGKDHRLSVRTFYPIAGLLVSRPSKPGGLGLTVKSGANGPHSHDDVGSFAIGLGTTQPVGEPGGPNFYNADTFSSKRLQSKLLNSFGHPVPRIGGHLQKDATHVSAPVVEQEFSKDNDRLVIDMTDAYDVPELKRLTRSMSLERSGTGVVELVDAYQLTASTEVEEAITTHGSWRQVDNKTLEFEFDGARLLATVTIPGEFKIVSEQVNEYGNPFTRVGIKTRLNGQQSIRIRFTKKPD